MLELSLYRRCGQTRGWGEGDVFSSFSLGRWLSNTYFFPCKLSARWSKFSSREDWPSFSTYNFPTVSPIRVGRGQWSRWQPRRYEGDPWSRGREVAPCVLRSSPTTRKNYFCYRRGIEILCRLFFSHQRPSVFFQTPGRRPPYVTGPSCDHCDSGVDRSLYRARPVQIPWRSHRCCRSMSVRNSKFRRFKWSVWVFLRPILTQHLARSCFLVFVQVQIFFGTEYSY